MESKQQIKNRDTPLGCKLNKGFTIYEKIDRLLNNDFWKEKIEFTGIKIYK